MAAERAFAKGESDMSGPDRFRRVIAALLSVVLGCAALVLSAPPAVATESVIVSIAEAELADATRNHEEPMGSDCSFYVGQTRGHMGACGTFGGTTWRAGSWCADFAKYVWRRAGDLEAAQPDRAGNLNGWAHSFYEYGKRHGTWHPRESGYQPRPGDAVVFDWQADGFDPAVGTFAGGGYDIDHVGIVKSADASAVQVIEGNVGDRVQDRSHARTSAAIVGYTSPSSVFWPTQSKGNRGADVAAIQYLLVHSGRSVSVDGDFGGGTDTAVRDFQSAKGLGADGNVGPNTWTALAVSVQQGNNNNAVRALQYQLNAKQNAGLTVDGDFGSGTKAAVVSFQQHAGIEANGIVGPITWRYLISHYQRIDHPATCASAASARWGTGAAIGQLTTAAARVQGAGFGQVAVRDVSGEHGGPVAGLTAHQRGMDVDVRPMRTDRDQCAAGVDRFSALYDRGATRELVRQVRATGRVKAVYFNDPVLIGEGLVTQAEHHDDRLQVRYCEIVHPDAQYDC
ncbi:peptidoglycan-binding protein [Actinokineospora sp. HUAS TT18]|uniref:peptidoglycan-binding protein n=1 Tax=Actinokineospora sp. HUAS TT18 TaxID=3447451 RepID=UPI003F51EA65